MLVVKNISFAYDQKLVLNKIDFSIEQGVHMSIIGESGCGKSTLLRAIYGLFDIHEGQIFWKGERVTGPSHNLVPGNPKMKYLAQDFGLMPYISVSENIGKFLSNLDLNKKKHRIEELLEMVNMQDFRNEKPLNLSGGQQQRTALAMVLAKSPELLLLDEPFSQIDVFQRNGLRRNLFNYLRENKITCIVATHDSADALAFSDKIMVMKKGEIVEFDSPENIYKRKRNPYTSALFSEINNVLHNGVSSVLYPHEISIVEKSKLKAVVIQSYFQGEYFLIECKDNYNRFFVKHAHSLPQGQNIYLSYSLD